MRAKIYSMPIMSENDLLWRDQGIRRKSSNTECEILINLCLYECHIILDND